MTDILVAIIVGAAGGSDARWREVTGPVEKLPVAKNVRSNWAVHPSGGAEELDTIAKAVEIARATYPYVAG
ncbi:hypothetical protein [Sphingomonas sp. RT2P30]|uniref:hypothetical protein n=1 Tax=Parasphingomonas halimpatiens TaxID=3096162 RepID=UPI002FC7CC33